MTRVEDICLDTRAVRTVTFPNKQLIVSIKPISNKVNSNRLAQNPSPIFIQDHSNETILVKTRKVIKTKDRGNTIQYSSKEDWFPMDD